MSNCSQKKSVRPSQAFSLPLISAAYSCCTDAELDFGTECLEVARKYGGAKVKLVSGGENLWKVTYAKDLDAVRSYLKTKHTRVAEENTS